MHIIIQNLYYIIKSIIARSSVSELTLYFLLFFTALEQLTYLFFGSFVYRYGIRIASVPIQRKGPISIPTNKELRSANLKVKADEAGKEIYFRYKYPSGVWGPQLLGVQIKMREPMILNVRIGIFTGFLIIFLIAGLFFRLFGGLLSGHVINFLRILPYITALPLVVWLLFRWFQRVIFKILKALR